MAYRDVKPEETTWEEYGHRMMEKRRKFRGDVKGRRYKRSDATAKQASDRMAAKRRKRRRT